MSSPPLKTEYFDHGLVRVTITRHGPEGSNDYSATLNVASRCFPHAPSREALLQKVRGALATLSLDTANTVLATEEEPPHE